MRHHSSGDDAMQQAQLSKRRDSSKGYDGCSHVVRTAEALNLALAALAQCETSTMDAATMESMIDRARDLADDLANAIDALPDPQDAGALPTDTAERARLLDDVPPLRASWSRA
jgi:hypothetical protein